MAGTLRYRLAWFVCLLLLTGFLLNSISSYFVSRDNVRQTITESSLPLTSDNIYSVIQRDVLKPIFISSMMANDAFLRDWALHGEANVAQMQRYLDEIRREYGTVTSFFVSEKTRNYYYWGGVLKRVDENEPRDAWYFRVRTMEQPFEINVDVDMANRDALTIFVNYRVYDYDGNYIGAAGTGLTVNRVNSQIEDYEQRFGREIFFVDKEGHIVVAPENSQIAGYGSLGAVPGLEERAGSLLSNNTEQRAEYERDGRTYFLNSRWVPELNWFLMVEQAEDQLLSPLRHTLLMNIGLALLITAGVAAMCVSAINRHQKGLEDRNAELSLKNSEIEAQKAELERSAAALSVANTRLSAMNREKDEFMGIVAHDLRSPMGGILGLCGLAQAELGEDGNPEQAGEYLDDIHATGMQMLELVGDLLDMSSIESFQGTLELEPCNWNHLPRHALETFQPQAATKEIEIIIELDAGAETEVLTREKWMSICLNNLLSNAIKYSPRGRRVWLGTTAEGDDWLLVHVRDEGQGIPQEELKSLFQKFRPLSPKPTAGEASSGLGLYIVQKMCQRLGAEISVESAPGKGSCFTIRHPRRQV